MVPHPSNQSLAPAAQHSQLQLLQLSQCLAQTWGFEHRHIIHINPKTLYNTESIKKKHVRFVSGFTTMFICSPVPCTRILHHHPSALAEGIIAKQPLSFPAILLGAQRCHLGPIEALQSLGSMQSASWGTGTFEWLSDSSCRITTRIVILTIILMITWIITIIVTIMRMMLIKITIIIISIVIVIIIIAITSPPRLWKHCHGHLKASGRDGPAFAQGATWEEFAHGKSWGFYQLNQKKLHFMWCNGILSINKWGLIGYLMGF